MTHLFRYEDQAGLRAFLEDRLGLSISLEAENVSPELPLDLSPDTRAALLRKCRRNLTSITAFPCVATPPISDQITPSRRGQLMQLAVHRFRQVVQGKRLG